MKRSIFLFKDVMQYFYRGWKVNLLGDYSRTFIALFLLYLNRFRHALPNKKNKGQQLKKLHTLTKGLHSLMGRDSVFRYSILISVDNPSANAFRSCLRSACQQTAPIFEILLGFKKQLTIELVEVLHEIKREFPSIIREFDLADMENELILNRLAQEAMGNFLFILEQEDWIRTDLLYRYEQTLRALPAPTQGVIYCDENKINHHDAFLSSGEVKRPILSFPYFFEGSFNLRGCLIPKKIWESNKGISQKYPGAENEDFVLRLEANGANFYHIPLILYSQRLKKSLPQLETVRGSLLQALHDYTKTKKLNWKWLPGYRAQDVRAIPLITKEHQVQVIIPFKDQKALTLSCIHTLLKQKHVSFKITAIDNASADPSIREEIKALGGEVLLSDEPFNYSRLNNLAVRDTTTAQDCDLILFLNNDVELHEEALFEMIRWIDQPQIGMVGCRLNYPDGRLQHGGIRLDRSERPETMYWEHIEKLCSFDQMQQTKALGVVDAVTAACALMKRQVFLDVGGFDEIWYPVANSDMNLAVKLQLKGLKSFYTPYAYGIHYESVSRPIGIEDFENLTWLHQHLLVNNHHLSISKFH